MIADFSVVRYIDMIQGNDGSMRAADVGERWKSRPIVAEEGRFEDSQKAEAFAKKMCDDGSPGFIYIDGYVNDKWTHWTPDGFNTTHPVDWMKHFKELQGV